MSTITRMPATVGENSTRYYRATLVDADGVAVPSANVSAITCWLQDGAGATINGRSAQDVLNANGGTLAATSGAFQLQLDPADNAIINDGLADELHRLTFEVEHSGGTETHVVEYYVHNISVI